LSKWVRALLANSFKYNWPVYLVVVAVFAGGTVTGFFGVERMQDEQAYELGRYLDRFIQQAGMIQVDTARMTRDVFVKDITLIASLYLLGLTIIGVPVMLGIVFTRGFVLGFAIGFLTKGKGLPGVVLACAAVLPQNIFFIPALLFGSAASLSFALILVKRFFNSKTAVWPSFVLYSCFMLMVAVFSCTAVLVEVYVTPALVKTAANTVFN